MPNMTQELERIAHAIAASRRQRAAAGRERRAAADDRHRQVGAQLRRLHQARGAMARALRKELAAGPPARRKELKQLMQGLHRDRESWRQQHDAMRAAERAGLAAFVAQLSADVAAMRDGFSSEQAERAEARRDFVGEQRAMLKGYAQDRAGAGGAWRGAAARPTTARPHHGRRAASGAEGAP